MRLVIARNELTLKNVLTWLNYEVSCKCDMDYT